MVWMIDNYISALHGLKDKDKYKHKDEDKDVL